MHEPAYARPGRPPIHGLAKLSLPSPRPKPSMLTKAPLMRAATPQRERSFGSKCTRGQRFRNSPQREVSSLSSVHRLRGEEAIFDSERANTHYVICGN